MFLSLKFIIFLICLISADCHKSETSNQFMNEDLKITDNDYDVFYDSKKTKEFDLIDNRPDFTTNGNLITFKLSNTWRTIYMVNKHLILTKIKLK